jgi:hypothetical protein
MTFIEPAENFDAFDLAPSGTVVVKFACEGL